ncbi:MAG: carboxypeptidase regulatory-like domain-containing protein [Terriglobus sp.]
MTKQFVRLALAAVTLSGAPVLLSPAVLAQAISVNGGSIGGTITDPSGAAVSGAAISIIGKDTGFKRDLATDKSGYYQIGPLNPGNYTVTVTAPGFQTATINTVIRVGTATPGSFKLAVGSSSTEISVEAGAVQVNTEQPGVSGVITQQQIDSLPINGRNFLDLAQLEPGVQLQNGNSFDPTKAGYSALAVNGVSGRTTRILLDGQDITDENVGTTIFNVAQGAIGEFQINHSTQDVSGEITSTGQVLVSTRTGTNAFHGNLFYNFQDNNAGFATFDHNNPPFQRNQFGGGVGGPIIKDKLFFFGDIERIKQDQSTSSTVSSTFNNIKSQFPSIAAPFRSTYSTLRLDYNGPLGGHYFVRGNYDVNASPSGSGYSLYVNRDNTWGIAGGADFATGRFTHSFRGSYEKFHNLIGDYTAGNSSLYNPIPGLNINFGAASLFTGPNANAPQATYQSDKQVRYDGSWTKGRHNIRFGGSYNRLLGGGLASFFGLAPRAYLYTNTLIGGDPSNPLNYAPRNFYVGNGQGYFSEIPQFGLPAGGQSDNRMALYVSDSWKISPSFTLTAGVRYGRDTLRANQDLGSIPCSAADLANFGGYVPCTGNANLLDQFGAGLGKRVNQPNMNFGPQIGFTWSPRGSGKTVFRGGYGIYYDSNIWNNILFDRENRLAKGLFNNYQLVQLQTSNPQVIFPGGVTVTTTPDGTPFKDLLNEPLSVSGPKLIALQKAYQAAVVAAGPSVNPNFVGETLSIQNSFYSPNYVSPYSQQLNFGIQRELATGMVLSVDYVHSVTLKIQQSIDMNHVGSARYLNAAAARNAIALTAADFGCTGSTPQQQVQCAINAGASLGDFESEGLDSGNNFTSGQSIWYAPVSADHNSPNTGAAFAGANPNLGNGLFNTPSGKSAYDAFQVNFRQQKQHPAPGIASSNLEVSYSYSHSTTTSRGGSNAFFTDGAWNYDAPSQFMGPSDLDQRHQISFGGSATLKYGPVIGLIGHFRSAPASNLTLDNTVSSDIFQSDVDGDGQAGDLAPGTNPGAFMRSVKPGNLKQFIANYNAAQAGRVTPAGQSLINAGLITQAQLVALNAVQQPLYSPNLPVFGNSWFRTMDASFGYPIHLRKISETFSLTPTVAMYNVANFSNWGGTTTTLLNTSNAGAAGADSATYVNGENPYLATKDQFRTQRGAGTYDQGGLRSTEFQLKLTF